MTDGALTARETGEILTELRMIRERLDRMDERLDAGDKRFREMDTERAAAEATAKAEAEVEGVWRSLALKVGMWGLGVVGSVGAAILYHVPFVAEWFFPPKGH